MNHRQALLAFSHFDLIGGAALKKLAAAYPDLSTAFRLPLSGLVRIGIAEKIASRFAVWRHNFNLDEALSRLKKLDIHYQSWDDPDYPALLREISSPPPVLYYRGRPPQVAERLAVVGSRAHSPYALSVIKRLIPPLARAGVIIVSGLARGVDSAAHRAAVEAGGVTEAILASGLNPALLYPRENRPLADKLIASRGCLLSEFPPDTPPRKMNFPRRNRIIAGLCRATLVIECGQQSGALITARQALEENREVMAVPGDIFSPFSAGPNRLIDQGARLVRQPEDIWEIYANHPPICEKRGLRL